jgi:hypothetical protein
VRATGSTKSKKDGKEKEDKAVTRPIHRDEYRTSEWRRFPNLTVVLISNTTDPEDAEDHRKYKPSVIYEGVKDWQDVYNRIKYFPDGSIPYLILSGHGGDGGVSTTHWVLPDGTLTNCDLDAAHLSDELANKIARKLDPEGIVVLAACDQADFTDEVKDLANKLQTRVHAINGRNVGDQPAMGDPITYELDCFGSWEEFDPDIKNDEASKRLMKARWDGAKKMDVFSPGFENTLVPKYQYTLEHKYGPEEAKKMRETSEKLRRQMLENPIPKGWNSISSPPCG